MKIVFLHGFLGSPSDWKEVISSLGSSYACYPLPLPKSLEEFPTQLEQLKIKECCLVGYSMGGRVALQLQQKYPDKIKNLVILSSHLGLSDPIEKNKRWEEDSKWIEHLLNLPLSEFLSKWYAQTIFSGFQVPSSRFKIDPIYHATLLKNYSLSKQQVFEAPENALFLYGEKDLKYQILYRRLKKAQIIKNCGHVIHLENPQGAAYAMDSFWKLSRHTLSQK